MEVKIHEINSRGVNKISYDDFHESKLNNSSVYLYEIISEAIYEIFFHTILLKKTSV